MPRTPTATTERISEQGRIVQAKTQDLDPAAFAAPDGLGRGRNLAFLVGALGAIPVLAGLA